MTNAIRITAVLAAVGVGVWAYMQKAYYTGGADMPVIGTAEDVTAPMTRNSVEDTITNALSHAVEAAAQRGEATGRPVPGNRAAERSEDPALFRLEYLLTVERFDADEVLRIVAEAGLDDMRMAMLEDTIGKAAKDPEMIETAIEQIKIALGL